MSSVEKMAGCGGSPNGPAHSVGEVRRVRVGGPRLDHAASQLGAVAPDAPDAELVLLAEQLHGPGAAIERLRLELLLLLEVL